ncbi:MAG: hypothetical protein RIR26_1955 [Pseudomonadota bacterium]|jgi:hypothetical protein
MKTWHWLVAGGVSAGSFFTATAAPAAARTESLECTLKYKKNEATVPMKEFNTCVGRFAERKKDVQFFQLLASSSAGGAASKRLKLVDSRIENLKKLLTADHPGVRIDAINAGSSAQLGDVVRMTTVLAAPEEVGVLEEGVSPVTTEERPLHTTAGAGKETGDVQIEPNKSEELPRVSIAPVVSAEVERENFGRVAARFGQDADRNLDESFPAIGLELAYVRPNTGTPHLRTEMGGTAVAMSKGNDLMKRASAHVLLGAGYNISGVVIGARALGGGVWDEKDKWRDDFGGEGRLGFENKNVSIFAGVGRTDKTSRFGLDVGLML